MAIEKSFKTKTGFCHILPDKIVLTRDGIIGNVANVTVGKSVTRILVVYGIISLILFYSSYTSYIEGQIFMPMLYISIGAFLIYSVMTSLNNSAIPIIERDKIDAVILKRGIIGLTRSRFEIMFEEEGVMKRRMVMLPGSMSDGVGETERAIKLLQEEGLLEE